MLRKYLTLFLAVILIAANMIPTAQAAKNDPLVLHTETVNGQTICHYYQDNGLLSRTVLPGSGNYIEYHYIEYMLLQEDAYENNKLSSSKIYDFYGTEVESFLYDTNGDVFVHTVSETTYDAFGRLTNLRRINVDNPSSRTTTFRYEYYNDPTVFFGYYEQDGNLSNGPEPIEWLALGTEGENVLLISKYGLDSRPYHNRNMSASWETSNIRDWLNGEFFDTAFPEFPVPFTTKYAAYFSLLEAPDNVSDRVFLLSSDEVKKYLPAETDRICMPTAYAIEQNAHSGKDSGTGWWLLRTPGNTDAQVANINADGSLCSDGVAVSSKEGLIRPAIWVHKAIFADCDLTPSRKHENTTIVNSRTGETQSLSSHLYTYNDAGLLISDNDYLNLDVRTWKYDDHGNLTHERFLSGTTSHYTDAIYTNRYSETGLLLEQECQSVKITNTKNITKTTETWLEVHNYDAAGRRTFTLRSYDDRFETVLRTYDAQGNLLTVSRNSVIEQEYTYVPLSQALYR